MPKLTKAFVERFEPPETGYVNVWDDSVKGYGLRVSSPSKLFAKGKKVFIAQGRVHGKAVCISIGAFGTFTEDQARKKAQRILQDMREGIDPRDARKADEAASISLEAVAHAYVGRPGKLKSRSIAEIERHVATTFGAWKDKPIAAITEDMCKARYRDMLTGGLLGKRPAPAQANQAFSILRALINYAARQYKRLDGSPLILHNPVDGLRDDWVPIRARTSRIPDNKVGEAWVALQEARQQGGTRFQRASYDLISLLLLTGCRLSEIASLRWEQVNLEEGWFHLPDPKNGNAVYLPLSKAAVKILEERERVEDSPFVLTTGTSTGHIRDPRETMKMLSEIAGTRITPHDLRRTYINIGVANAGVDPYKIELLTNHVPSGVTAKHYLDTTHLQYLAPETEAISGWIEQEAAMVLAKRAESALEPA